MKDHHFKQLMKSIAETRDIQSGKKEPSRVFRYAPMEVKKIREKLKLTQAEFAKMICVSLATLRNWEQGRTYPEGAAIALLRVADSKPEAVLEALHAA